MQLSSEDTPVPCDARGCGAKVPLSQYAAHQRAHEDYMRAHQPQQAPRKPSSTQPNDAGLFSPKSSQQYDMHYVSGLIPLLHSIFSQKPHVQVYLCNPCQFFFRSAHDGGFGCGYKNIQTLCSALLQFPLFRKQLFHGLLADEADEQAVEQARDGVESGSAQERQQQQEWRKPAAPASSASAIQLNTAELVVASRAQVFDAKGHPDPEALPPREQQRREEQPENEDDERADNEKDDKKKAEGGEGGSRKSQEQQTGEGDGGGGDGGKAERKKSAQQRRRESVSVKTGDSQDSAVIPPGSSPKTNVRVTEHAPLNSVHRGGHKEHFTTIETPFPSAAAAASAAEDAPVNQALKQTPELLVRMPTIPMLQRLIDQAHDSGFDVVGASQVGRLRNSKTWIGAVEAHALFCSYGLRSELIDFKSSYVGLMEVRRGTRVCRHKNSAELIL